MFGVIKINQDAPNFSLNGVFDGKEKIYELNSFQNKWLLVFFYNADFDPKSNKEILELNKLFFEFKNLGCKVVAISTDSVLTHINWLKTLGEKINFPVLSDKHHAACIDFNVFEDKNAQPFNSLFLINPERKINWFEVCDKNIDLDLNRPLQVLKQVLKV
jgi:peroxiredoxin (alkyl hydroperoxide reductase subunit C)